MISALGIFPWAHSGVAYAAALVLEPSLVPAGTLPQALACLLAGALCLTLWVLARRTAFRALPPKHERPSMSSPIRYERPE
ncbi:MAG: hypothetical protein IJ231_07550 [Clostridia bacterium]|nr:hypothetical protein [Clostridia bacterium]